MRLKGGFRVFAHVQGNKDSGEIYSRDIARRILITTAQGTY